MFSINNCFMLSAIVTRCLRHTGGHAVYCSGRVTLLTSSGPARIGHAWVEICEGEKPAIIDVTIDMQSAWGEARLDDVAHIRPGDVLDERIHYEGQRADLDAVWRQYTPPSEGNPYTRASQKQQQHITRQVVAKQNRAWAMFVLEYGLWNGTYRLLQDMIDASAENRQKRQRRRRKAMGDVPHLPKHAQAIGTGRPIEPRLAQPVDLLQRTALLIAAV